MGLCTCFHRRVLDVAPPPSFAFPSSSPFSPQFFSQKQYNVTDPARGAEDLRIVPKNDFNKYSACFDIKVMEMVRRRRGRCRGGRGAQKPKPFCTG